MIHGQNGTSNQLHQTPLGNLLLDSSVGFGQNQFRKPFAAAHFLHCATLLLLALGVGTTFTALAQWLERSRASTGR